MSADARSRFAAELELAIDADRRLREAVLAAHADGVVEPSASTVLPDWTVGHVLTHIARNADSHRQMLAGEPQYGGSVAGRNADIAKGATRSAADIVDDVVTSSQRLVEAWASADWSGTATTTLGAEVGRDTLPLLRTREVEVHRTDLGLPTPHAFGFDDMAPEYVRRDLRQLEMIYKSRLPMGMTGMPNAITALAPARRLAWMMGRIDIDGVRPANLFG